MPRSLLPCQSYPLLLRLNSKPPHLHWVFFGSHPLQISLCTNSQPSPAIRLWTIDGLSPHSHEILLVFCLQLPVLPDSARCHTNAQARHEGDVMIKEQEIELNHRLKSELLEYGET